MSAMLPPIGSARRRDSDAQSSSLHQRPSRLASKGTEEMFGSTKNGAQSARLPKSRPSLSTSSSGQLASIFQSSRRRNSKTWGEDEDEEKISPERQEIVRMRGRYSKQHMADFGMVFDSSDIGNEYAFNPETADPISGVHFHRNTTLSLQNFKPKSAYAQQEAAATFATEEDASPRANLSIGSYGQNKNQFSHSHSASHDSLGSVAETTGRTIWQMWKSMKRTRAREQQQDLMKDVPTRSQAPSPDHANTGDDDDKPSVDYVEAGKLIAAQLSRAGVKLSHNHLDVIHNLAGLEKVWLKTDDGLAKEEFVAFLHEVLRLPEDELSILFQKMDANGDGDLSWDEYLSYLLIEVSHHWQFRSARGTWHLKDVDTPATPINAQVQQILIIPRDATASTVNGSAGKYVLSCKDNTIQVWNSQNLTYQCHLPPPWKTPDMKTGLDEAHSVANALLGGGQTSRIGQKRGGGGRQKRCGGGGWKEEGSYTSRLGYGHHSSTTSSSMGGIPKQGTIDESISRRAAHAGLARLSMVGASGSSESGSLSARGGMMMGSMNDEGQEQQIDRDKDGEREILNPFSRARQSQGVLHTTVAYYPTHKQLLVATMDKSIHVYQQSFRQYIQVDRTEVIDTPQCMTVHMNNTGASSYQSSAASQSQFNSDLLIVGDTSGRCSAYHLPVSRDFSAAAGMLGEKSSNITSGVKSTEMYNTSMGGVGHAAGGLTSDRSSLVTSFATSARPLYAFQTHRLGESVRKVSMIPNVGLVSAGMDAKLHISDLETEKVVRSLVGHKRGVYSFAHCESHRCIFSAGFDSKVLVFDPYLPTPTGSLASHHTNILDVVVNERKNQIITTCADKKIKVFDIRTFKMIHSLADSQEYTPYDELSAVNFDHEQQQLVTAGNKLRVWPVVIAPGNKARRGGPAHSNLVVAICYSQVFQQIISVSVDESVHLWDIYTGRSVFEFRTTHGSPLTAACLDHRGKRLVTGAHDGSVFMWNFNNGAKMHEFQARKREINSLLYLPNTLQCVVGIGWERSVVRWPDPSAPKSTEWLVQPDHKAEVSSLAYFGSHLVSGGSDGEIIVWHMDSARVFKRFEIPKTPRTGKRPGVAKMTFVDFPSGLLLLLAGTDDGSVHFMKISSSETVFSLFEVMNEPIVGLAVSRVYDPNNHDHDQKFTGMRTRLLVCDCQVEAKLFDISNITNDHIETVPLLKSWEPHPGGTTTDVIAVDDISSFMTSSDNGDISVWSTEGDLTAKFAQRKNWPIADPRTSSRSIEEIEAAERREQGGGESDDSDISDESDSELQSGLSTRHGSTLSSPSHGAKNRQKRRQKAITPPRKEVSFAESHPPYIPRDECERYLREHQQQVLMEANADKATRDKERAAREREQREEKKSSHAKSLPDMLAKLEHDLKLQHERSQGMSLTDSASSGGHVYDKFHLHHATGASANGGTMEAPLQASNLDPLADDRRAAARPRRSYTATAGAPVGSDDESHSGYSSTRSTSRSLRAPPLRVSLASGTRTISNSDVFVQPRTSKIRAARIMATQRV